MVLELGWGREGGLGEGERVDFYSLQFLLDGQRINKDATPKTLELDDQDQIE